MSNELNKDGRFFSLDVRNNIASGETDQRPIDCIKRGAFGTRQYQKIIIITGNILVKTDPALYEFFNVTYMTGQKVKYFIMEIIWPIKMCLLRNMFNKLILFISMWIMFY